MFQRGSNKRVPKRGKVYLLTKYERRLRIVVKYGNKILRKYLCTCNF